MRVSLLTGGFDKPYAFGITMALAAQGVDLEVVGSTEIDCQEMHSTKGVQFINLHGQWACRISKAGKLAKVVLFYVRLLKYSAFSRSCVFHILWNNKIPFFDRTFLLMIYKALGKLIVFTAHNINAGERDGTDSFLNRVTLGLQYRLVDHVFVHTQKMRQQLIQDYRIRPEAVTVIPFGLNNAVPRSGLRPSEARRHLGIADHERTILFFGNIRAYKGLHYLVEAFEILVRSSVEPYRLIIAGSRPNKEGERYWDGILSRIERGGLHAQILQRTEFVPDVETELYFSAADVAVLPYVHIYQSGVLSLSYSFGLPVIATKVGSFEEEIIEGETGFLCKVSDPPDLARAIKMYFASSLYAQLEERRGRIRRYAEGRYSWDIVATLTRGVYLDLLRGRTSRRASGQTWP